MAPKVGRLRIVGSSLLLAVPLAVLAASAGADAAPCRVRNVTQDTHGRSLVQMIKDAVDGDRLRVHGTCRGTAIIDADIDVRGADDGAVLTGRNERRVVKVAKGALVTLSGVIIQRGNHPNEIGGGILNNGTLLLVDAIVRRNRDIAIVNDGTMTVRRSEIRRNTGFTGGIANHGGRLTVVASRIRDNHAVFRGGGIDNLGTVVLTDTVVTKNSSEERGGGVNNDATLRIADSIVSGNEAGTRGGGLHNGGTAELTSSAVRENVAGAGGGGVFNDFETTLTLTDSRVTANTAQRPGGGIRNNRGSGNVFLDAASSVTGNTPDDCVGTPAC